MAVLDTLTAAFVLGARAPQNGAGLLLRIKTKGATRSLFLLAWIQQNHSRGTKEIDLTLGVLE
jgi:hypothetical protein